MSSIKDFEKTNKEKTQTMHEPTSEDLENTRADYSDLIELFLNKYGEMDEDELIAEMIKLINEKKKQGTYDPQQLKELALRVKPFLDDSQKAKMEELLNLL